MKHKIDFVDKLTDILVKMKLVSQSEAQAMKKDFEDRSQIAFDQFLLEEGLIAKEDLLTALSEYYQVPYFDCVGFFFDHDLLRNFPKDFLLDSGVIPVQLEEEILLVVANEPEANGLRDKIARYANYVVEFNVGIMQDIQDAIEQYYDESDTAIKDLLDDDETDDASIENAVLYPDQLADDAQVILDDEDDHEDEIDSVIDKIIDDESGW